MSTLESIFGPKGLFSHRLPDYEFRPSQLQMAEAVEEAIRGRRHLCAEAGTGTGKTLAYLVPALLSRRRVLVSTATLNLQEQLFFKDIPFIREHLLPELSAVCMKGRQNYLCRLRLRRLQDESPTLPMAEDRAQGLRSWAQVTETGDRSELDWTEHERGFWGQVDAGSDTCVGQKCEHFDDCFITLMRQKAMEADVVVVNHALLFSNLALEKDEIGRVLPDFSIAILDEAHEVEDVAATFFGNRVSSLQLDELCRDLSRQGGAEVEGPVEKLRRRSLILFESLPFEQGRYSLTAFPEKGSLRDLRSDLQVPAEEVMRAVEALRHGLQRKTGQKSETDPLVRRLERLAADLRLIFGSDGPAADRVCWFERRRSGVFLHSNPIDVASLLRENLFSRGDSAILASATLTTEGTFDYVRERLGVPDPMEVAVPGEFDYASQAVLYVPRTFPEPGSPVYPEHALVVIQHILEITEGAAFLLFSSFQQLERMHALLQDRIPYPLLRQGDLPRNRLLEKFRRTRGAVLCATSSFWQGVDVRGDALKAVIIDKIPFQVPTEPLVAARLRRLKDEGRNPFLHYSVPEAVITLKQGLGRLIRSRRDRGILAVLDSRLRTRSYGAYFLRSLPRCRLTDNIEALKNFFR